jgi:hypothetical protein
MAQQQTPQIQDRAAQPYVGVTRTVTMTTIPEVADRLPELFTWLGERGVTPAGAPFFRYREIDMERELVVEAGVPVDSLDAIPDLGTDAMSADQDSASRPHGGVLPAGRYVVVQHHGHPDDLERATGELLAWAAAQGLVWDADDEQRSWGARVESYLTDPADEPDMTEWDHELAFRLAD